MKADSSDNENAGIPALAELNMVQYTDADYRITSMPENRTMVLTAIDSKRLGSVAIATDPSLFFRWCSTASRICRPTLPLPSPPSLFPFEQPLWRASNVRLYENKVLLATYDR